MVLPFKNGKPLASSAAASGDDSRQQWQLGWLDLDDLRVVLGNGGCGELSGGSFVYLGLSTEDDAVYWAIEVSSESGLIGELEKRNLCFIELRTLMVATDCVELRAMGNLAIAGHARALLEWHRTSRFCGHCGEKTVPMEAGRRKQCSNESCKKTIYPRIDPVVIMLVIDQENDRALLCKQSRFVPRMWSCLAGFIEPGESLEEAVRRETWEETGIEVGEVVYHSSQPWPVGPSSMPCQLMVGFLAYAKSLEIKVDKEELQDARWYSREDVKKALTFAEYKKAQRNAAAKDTSFANSSWIHGFYVGLSKFPTPRAGIPDPGNEEWETVRNRKSAGNRNGDENSSVAGNEAGTGMIWEVGMGSGNVSPAPLTPLVLRDRTRLR
ncbi:Nucleoside diphosphate-linked moiety X motif 19, mitochondrial [Stylosanthes scabra]|uniref:NAD(+) diphosphatase n=1 Tax=Stylosanthes scabra TaxID=79078 RepID=A0ABU6X6D1_9FABA|nr:Nucleoside diphosphate-linked moiety X motif 19, mitochondrial [Stylosanthes scabra]